MRRMWFVVMLIGACAVPAVARADPLGTAIPANCSAHHGWGAGEADAPGDYRCAGLAIQFHTGGVGRSPGLIWAGQWLFRDSAGEYRVGSCTFNRGVHPNILGPSALVAQAFPDDPTGGKGAYLAWRYGDTTDNLTAAAMWAVLHFYAQDAAGSRRAGNPTAPLIASLDRISAMSGRNDLQARAEALDAEAIEFSAPWRLELAVGVDATVSLAVMSGQSPIAGATIELRRDGRDPLRVTTGADGRAVTTVATGPGELRLTASTSAPGAVAVYRGPPAEPNPWGAQTLATAGPPSVLTATRSVDVPAPITTVPTTAAVPTTVDAPTTTAPPATTTEPPTTTATTTTQPASTTTEVPTTTTSTTTTQVPTTTTTEVLTTSNSEVPTTSTTTSTTTTTEVRALTTDVPTTTSAAPATDSSTSTTPLRVDDLDTTTTTIVTTTSEVTTTMLRRLPVTGGRTDPPAMVGTALLVGGIGLIGTVRRRTRRVRPPFFDPDA